MEINKGDSLVGDNGNHYWEMIIYIQSLLRFNSLFNVVYECVASLRNLK